MKKAVVIGAGIGGLAAAIRLACIGYQVTVLERESTAGGKLGELQLGPYRFDTGPSLFTLPEEVEALFTLAGKKKEDFGFSYSRLDPITHYFWPDGLQLKDAADPATFANNVAEATNVPAKAVEQFLAKSAELYNMTEPVFLKKSLHRLCNYLSAETRSAMLKLHKLDALHTLHQRNAATFNDARVVQLFDRFATYNGSNPYQAPATLKVIPGLEMTKGAYFAEGGIRQIVEALHALANSVEVTFIYNAAASKIATNQQKQVEGVESTKGFFPASVVVSNADVEPTYRHLLPQLKAPERILKQQKSSSALILYWGIKKQFPQLGLHNVFFSADYKKEFRQIFKEKTVPTEPTLYLYNSSLYCPTDAPEGHSNFFIMLNTPPNTGQNWERLRQQAREYILKRLSADLAVSLADYITEQDYLDPLRIESRTGSPQGALYGISSNNKLAAFFRHPNFSNKVKGLYFCGGSVHPGGGIPLCLLSARITADLVKEREH